MDAVIRFCFKKDPEKLDEEEYCKLYGQGKYILDYQNTMMVANASKAAL